MEHVKIAAEKKMERKKCEMEEMQRLRSYESAKADAVAKM